MVHLFSDYHSHPQGHRTVRYSQELLQPWIDRAREHGLSDVAFTDHDRYHIGVDFDEIELLRERNPDVRIRAGIELDNDPETSAAGRKWVEANWDRLDFVLGSVHYLYRDDVMFDTVPAGAAQFDDARIDTVYADYFERIGQMISTGLVDCLAHIDLVKIHGHRPEAAIESIIDQTLTLVQANNLAIELSTAGWRKPVDEMYPQDAITRLANEKGIPFTTASDAHSAVQLADNFDRLGEKMSAIGVQSVSIYEKHNRTVVTL